MKPMLATAVKDIESLTYPLYASPKADGIRVIIIDGQVMSRSLKPIPNKHIQEMFGIAELEGLDGELIVGKSCENNTFNTSTSVIMSHNKHPDEHGGATLFVFDIVNDKPYEERYTDASQAVLNTGKANVQLLEHTLCTDAESLLKAHTENISQGWEGTMTRSPKGKYKYGRSTLKQEWLLKLKDFDDAEGIVIGMTELMHNENESVINALGRSERSTKKEGKRPAGMMGTLVLQTEWNGRIVELELGTGFSENDRKEMWKDKEGWIGKIVKYKFQRHGSMERPRLPVFLGERDGRDM